MNANNINTIVFASVLYCWFVIDLSWGYRLDNERIHTKIVMDMYYDANQKYIATDSLLHAQNPRTIEADLRSRLRGVQDSAKIVRQAIAESGNFNSNRFRRHNALFGEQHHRPVEYCHWHESLRYYIGVLYRDRNRYKTFAKFLDGHKFEHDYE
jgi:hypothetical protein